VPGDPGDPPEVRRILSEENAGGKPVMKTAVIVNIRSIEKVPVRQQTAWGEFLDMLMERAGAMNTKSGEGCDSVKPLPEGESHEVLLEKAPC
jgi:hypothetical protein